MLLFFPVSRSFGHRRFQFPSKLTLFSPKNSSSRSNKRNRFNPRSTKNEQVSRKYESSPMFNFAKKINKCSVSMCIALSHTRYARKKRIAEVIKPQPALNPSVCSLCTTYCRVFHLRASSFIFRNRHFPLALSSYFTSTCLAETKKLNFLPVSREISGDKAAAF